MATAKTRTPNLKLILPDFNQVTWSNDFYSNMRAIDAVLTRYFTIANYEGEWENSTLYEVGDRVLDSDLALIFECNVQHVSSAEPTTFAANRVANPTYWTAFTEEVQFRGEWVASTEYAAGDFVTVTGTTGETTRLAVATTGHTADSSDFDTDLANGLWTVLINAANFGDAELNAIAAIATTGILARTADNVWTTRSVVAPAAGITITNGNGVAGNPTLVLANDLAALEGLGSTGIAVRTAADTWAQRQVTGANGITVTNGNGVSGNIALSIADNAISGDKIDGGTISNFASTGIDDNATSTAMTINASNELIVGGNAGSGLISARNDAGDAIISALASATGKSIFRMGDINDFTRARLEYDHSVDAMVFVTSTTEKMRIDSSGLVGINTNAPAGGLHVVTTGTAITPNAVARTIVAQATGATSSNCGISILAGTSANSSLYFGDSDDDDVGYITYDHAANAMVFQVNASEALRINSSGVVGIGISSPTAAVLQVTESATGQTASVAADQLVVDHTGSGGISILSANNAVGSLFFGDTDDPDVGRIRYDHNDNSMQFTTAAGEAMRIDSSGNLVIGKTAVGLTATAGIDLFEYGEIRVTRTNDRCFLLNRTVGDGTLVAFLQDGTQEGAISVSGTTVTYGSFSGSHTSQLKSMRRQAIPRGTVMCTIDELIDGKTTERLAKVEVCKHVASPSVYGVFMDYTPKNEQHIKGEMLVTGLGAFIVRMAKGQTPQIGDLVESAGGGCARVQSDTTIKSSTIGKITATKAQDTYEDGSFTVPCVLYCG